MSIPPPPPPAGGPSHPAPSPFQSQSQSQSAGPPPGYAPYGVAAPQRNSGMAIAGFVLSLVGLFPGFWFWWLQIPAYLGTIFSAIGLKATRVEHKRGRGLAIAGLVIGIVGVLAAAAFTTYVYTSDDCDRESIFEVSCRID